MVFGGIEVVRDYTFRLKDGRDVFITHGDDFDIVTKYHSWLAKLGDVGYEILLRMNKVVNRIRRAVGYTSHFSLSQFVKYQVKQAVNFISDFEETVTAAAKEHVVDGVICGHIHHAEIREIGNMQYMNCGDWVESCTALVENDDGKLEIIRWTQDALR